VKDYWARIRLRLTSNIKPLKEQERQFAEAKRTGVNRAQSGHRLRRLQPQGRRHPHRWPTSHRPNPLRRNQHHYRLTSRGPRPSRRRSGRATSRLIRHRLLRRIRRSGTRTRRATPPIRSLGCRVPITSRHQRPDRRAIPLTTAATDRMSSERSRIRRTRRRSKTPLKDRPGRCSYTPIPGRTTMASSSTTADHPLPAVPTTVSTVRCPPCLRSGASRPCRHHGIRIYCRTERPTPDPVNGAAFAVPKTGSGVDYSNFPAGPYPTNSGHFINTSPISDRVHQRWSSTDGTRAIHSPASSCTTTTAAR
jgi:hypothetical protein